MDFILNLPSSPFAAGFPFHRRLIGALLPLAPRCLRLQRFASTASRGGAPGLAGNALPPFSARRISIASSSPSFFRRVLTNFSLLFLALLWGLRLLAGGAVLLPSRMLDTLCNLSTNGLWITRYAIVSVYEKPLVQLAKVDTCAMYVSVMSG
jgi:hypothetical protein